MNEVYKLRCTLLGHSMDVRGVTSGETECGKSFIVSGSRDRSSKVWMSTEDGLGFQQFQSCEGHTNFVSCVCVIPPSPKYPQGIVLTGGHDHTILGFELGKHNPSFRLMGHKGTVCSIAVTTDYQIVTGSWDQTAKIWANQQNIATLVGHEAAVWAVATIPGSEQVLTGSADKMIRLWIDYKPSKVFEGHTDCVRALAIVNSDQFLSGSNDASIRLWSVSQGDTIQIFYGHSNFIYSISLLPNGEDFVSVGEDRTLRIWKGTECQQVIFHPAISIWSVSVMKNGDIITGSSDGTIRVFTNNQDRYGDPEILAQFEQEVSQSTIAAQQDLGGMKVSELPGPEALLREGKKDGDTKMVREGNGVGCYSWSAADRKWTKVGDVVGASGATQNTSGKVLHDGKEYDYVFNVDMDEKGTLKLPYNITEDPWFAAQKFIDKNDLSQLFLDQVANFIVTNTKGMQLEHTNSNFADPFTGENRYVPSTSSAPASSSGGGLDPFTGAGAYTTSSAKPSIAPNLLTGEVYFPVKQFLRFAQSPNYDALRGKLNEFVVALGEGSGVVIEDVDVLLSTGKSPIWNEKVDKLVKYCLSWPLDKVFPVLDLIRLGVLTSSFALGMNGNISICRDLPEKFLTQENGTNQMLTLRILCNLFGILTDHLMLNRSALVSQVLSNLAKSKNNQIAAATLVLNFSIICSGSYTDHRGINPEWVNIETQTEILMAAISLMDLLEDPEAHFRVLVSLGTLLSSNKTLAELFKSLNGGSVANNYKDNGATPKIKQCSAQILACL